MQKKSIRIDFFVLTADILRYALSSGNFSHSRTQSTLVSIKSPLSSPNSHLHRQMVSELRPTNCVIAKYTQYTVAISTNSLTYYRFRLRQKKTALLHGLDLFVLLLSRLRMGAKP